MSLIDYFILGGEEYEQLRREDEEVKALMRLAHEDDKTEWGKVIIEERGLFRFFFRGVGKFTIPESPVRVDLRDYLSGCSPIIQERYARHMN